MSAMITDELLTNVFTLFAQHPGGSVAQSPIMPQLSAVQHVVSALFDKDYIVQILPNRNGELCTTYPLDIVNVVAERQPTRIDVQPSALNTTNTNNHTLTMQSDQTLLSTTNLNDDDNNNAISKHETNNQHGNDAHISNLATELASEDSEQEDDEPIFGMDDSMIETLPVENGRDQAVSLAQMNRVVGESRVARVRTRFPVSVLVCNTHRICRSSTLAHKFELILHASLSSSSSHVAPPSPSDSDSDAPPLAASPHPADTDPSAIGRARLRDIELLQLLDVKYICDLMVCSSEKVDQKDRYGGFAIASMPFPGCEFFATFAAAGMQAKGLMPQWRDDDPSGGNRRFHEVAPVPLPTSYRNLSLVRLTQDYLQIMLRLAGDGGLLLHCISGWDRTPLFVSLLRMSLWADGCAHQTLTADELLFLTVGYDWLLFGHQLRTRAARNEHVFAYCFHFLQFIEDDQFSLQALLNPACSANTNDTINNNNNYNNTVNNDNHSLNTDVLVVDQSDRRSQKRQSQRQQPHHSSNQSPTLTQDGHHSPQSPAAPAPTASSPKFINGKAAGGAASPLGTPMAGGSWQLVDETSLSASSFDATIGVNTPTRDEPRTSRRARRLRMLRERFEQLYSAHVAPTLASVTDHSVADLNGASSVGDVAAAGGHAVASYTRTLFSNASRAVSAVASMSMQ